LLLVAVEAAEASLTQHLAVELVLVDSLLDH
jgi:hypothetical protein